MASTFGYKQPRQPASSFLTDTTSSALAAKSPLAKQLSGFGPAPTPRAAPAPRVPPAQTRGAQSPAYRPISSAYAQSQNTTPTPGVYDLNTDPVLQQITAFTGQSDEQANAGALKQRQQLLTNYGDQGLAAAVLGQGDPFVQAAGQNPTSILAQLATQHDRNTHNLTEQLNQANLFYSGYRALQEQQAAQDYQTQLAAQAAGVQGGLDSITGNLAAALASNQHDRQQAASDAYMRALQEALANPAQAPLPSDYQSSTQPGSIYSMPDGSLVSVQPSGALAPAYPGPTGDIVSPETYAGAGAMPGPIGSPAPPIMPTPPTPNLSALANLLYQSALGGGGSPITSVIPRRGLYAG